MINQHLIDVMSVLAGLLSYFCHHLSVKQEVGFAQLKKKS